MKLPDTTYIQCNCGSFIKIDISFVTGLGDFEGYHQTVTAKETNELIREQLCECGHMLFIHNKEKHRQCLKSGCLCTSFVKTKMFDIETASKRKKN